MATYYISNSLGNDAWSGTLPDPNGTETDGPKQTLSAAATLLNAASPGDSVLLRRGDTWNTGLSIERAQGSEGLPITLADYSSGDLPKLDVTQAAGQILAVSGGGSDFITYLDITNIHLTSSADPPNRPTGMLLFDNNDVFPSNINLTGLLIDNLRQGMVCYFDTLTIDSCTIRNCFKQTGEGGDSHGAFLQGDNVTVRDCLFRDNGKVTSQFDHQLYLSHCEGTNLVEDNEIDGGPDGIKIRSCHNLTVKNNLIYGMDAHGVQVGGCSDQDNPDKIGAPNHYSSNVIIDSNRIHTVSSGIVCKTQSGTSTNASVDIIIRNNLCYGYVAGSLGDQPGILNINSDDIFDNLEVYNNVFWGDSNNSVAFYQPTTNLANSIFKNNIMFTDNASIPLLRSSTYAFSNVDFDNNIYYRTDGGDLAAEIGGSSYATLAALQVDYSSLESNGQAANPTLVNPASADFHLASDSSPAVNAGASLGTPVVESHTSNFAISSASLTLTKPSGVVPGDLLIILLAMDPTGSNVMWNDDTLKPTGFTFINHVGDSTTQSQAGAFWRIADGTEGATIDCPSFNAHDYCGFYARISGVDQTTPIHVIGSDVEQTTETTSHAITGLNTTLGNCLVVYLLSFNGGDGVPYSVSGTGWSQVNEEQVSVSGVVSSTCWGTRELITSGASGTATVTSSVSDLSCSFQFAIAPEVITDFDGISRPDDGSWDVGALEYVGFIPPAAQLVISAGVPIFFEGQGTSVSVSPDAGQLMLDGVVNYTNTTDYTTTSTVDVPPGSDFVLVKNKRDGNVIDRLGGFTPLNIKPEK